MFGRRSFISFHICQIVADVSHVGKNKNSLRFREKFIKIVKSLVWCGEE